MPRMQRHLEEIFPLHIAQRSKQQKTPLEPDKRLQSFMHALGIDRRREPPKTSRRLGERINSLCMICRSVYDCYIDVLDCPADIRKRPCRHWLHRVLRMLLSPCGHLPSQRSAWIHQGDLAHGWLTSCRVQYVTPCRRYSLPCGPAQRAGQTVPLSKQSPCHRDEERRFGAKEVDRKGLGKTHQNCLTPPAAKRDAKRDQLVAAKCDHRHFLCGGLLQFPCSIRVSSVAASSAKWSLVISGEA